jgi:uncharacterized membrane protein
MGIFFSNRQKKSEMFTSNCHIARNMFRIEVDLREDHDLKHALTSPFIYTHFICVMCDDKAETRT